MKRFLALVLMAGAAGCVDVRPKEDAAAPARPAPSADELARIRADSDVKRAQLADLENRNQDLRRQLADLKRRKD